MYFLFEAFRRRPLESVPFTYFRALCAAIFVVLFIVYCAYLILQIINDVPLLLSSRKELQDSYPLPQIEMCSENSSMTIVRCDLMYTNYTMSTIPNCYDYIRVGEAGDTPSRCYLFDSGESFKYGVKQDYEPTTSDLRRIDIYWKIDSILNTSLASISVPSITMELYDHRLSRWNPSDYIPELLAKNILLGKSRLITSQNTTTTIFFTPTLYQAIRSGDPLSILGFAPDYNDFIILEAAYLEWPLKENENITKGDYHGMFNVQIGKPSLDIQSERRQYTILSAVALAGGAYGALSTLYVLLFGMLRLSPFGVFNQIPIKTLRGIEAIRKMRHKSTQTDDDDFSNNNKSDQLLLDDAGQPSKLDTLYTSSSTNVTTDSGMIQEQHTSSGKAGVTQQSWSQDCRHEAGNNGCSNNNSNKLSEEPNHGENPITVKRIHQLERQVFELQKVLREYYIDMDYLDNHRNLRRRRGQHASYYDRQSSSVEGGWIFDDSDDEPMYKDNSKCQ